MRKSERNTFYSLPFFLGFPGGSEVKKKKNPPAKQEIRIQSLGQEDPPREGNGNLLQYICLRNPMDREPWGAIVHGVTEELDMI